MKAFINYVSIVIISILLFPTVSKAEIYAYRDSRGRIHITNIPINKTKTSFSETELLEKSSKTTGNTTYSRYINKYSKKYKIDPDIVSAIIKVESNFNRWAVSPVGARGLMQLMPSTAKTLGVKNIFHPEDNIQGGTKYLRQMLDRFDNNVYLALAAYNAGPAAVDKYKGIPRYAETRKFVQKVMKYYKLYNTQNAEYYTSQNQEKIYSYRSSDGKIHLTNVSERMVND